MKTLSYAAMFVLSAVVVTRRSITAAFSPSSFLSRGKENSAVSRAYQFHGTIVMNAKRGGGEWFRMLNGLKWKYSFPPFYYLDTRVSFSHCKWISSQFIVVFTVYVINSQIFYSKVVVVERKRKTLMRPLLFSQQQIFHNVQMPK